MPYDRGIAYTQKQLMYGFYGIFCVIRYKNHFLQGFCKNISLPKSTYFGYIKEYEGAHLMHVRSISSLWFFIFICNYIVTWEGNKSEAF